MTLPGRKLLLVIALVLVSLGALLALLPVLVSSQIVRQQVANQITAITGSGVTLRGDQALRVFPSPSIEVSDVVVAGGAGGAEGALLVAEQLQGSVRLLPLIFGRVELSSVTLTRPAIALVRAADGAVNWSDGLGDMPFGIGPVERGDGAPSISSVRLVDASVIWRDETTGTEETITGANLVAQLTSNFGRSSLSGDMIWRGEAVELGLSLDQPGALALSGSTSGFVMTVASTPLRLRFDGTITPGNGTPDGDAAPGMQPSNPWQLVGSLDLSSPSLRRLASWLGRDIGPGSTFGAFSLNADLNLLDRSADLTDLALSLDGNEAEGVLNIEVGDDETASRLQGTLDFDRLDLSAYLGSLRPTTTASAPGEWRFISLPDVFSSGIHADVRIATRQVLAAPLQFGEAAGSVLIADDRMVLGIGEAVGYGGSFRGSLTLDRGPGPDPLQRAKSRVDLAIEGVQLGPVLSALTETPRLRGTASVDLMLAGTGPTLATLIQSVEGEVIGRLDEGAWDGADLSALAQSLAEGSGLDLQALAGGSTDITRLDARLSLGAGTLMVEDAMLLGEGFAVEGAGSAGIATQNLALEGAMLVDVDDSEPQRFPFTLGGTWTQPMVLPRDEESLPDAQGTTSP